MLNDLNYPCQVCSITSTTGSVKPVWVRFKDQDGILRKLDILECFEDNAVKKNSAFFKCTAELEGYTCRFLLRYLYGSNQFTLLRMLD